MLGAFYIDLMAKAGRSQTKVDAKDVDYKISMPYYNASFGVGKKIKFDSFILDNGLNYALSYVGSDEADIGQSTLKFSSVTSSRAKIYSKIAYDAGKFNPYGKISAEYRFNTKSKNSSDPRRRGDKPNSKRHKLRANLCNTHKFWHSTIFW